MSDKLCECGCGEKVVNDVNRFISGHNTRIRKISQETRDRMSNSLKGRSFSTETKKKMSKSATGRINTQDHNLKISKSLKSLKIKLTTDQKLNLSKFHSGKKISQETKMKLSNFFTGRPLSEETKIKIGLSNIGKHHSEETKTKISKSSVGKKISLESRIKMSLSHIRYLEITFFNGEKLYPATGKNETQILDVLQQKIDYQIIRNNPFITEKTGKFPDGYISELNLVIEIDEPHHYTPNGSLRQSDQDRDSMLKSKIGCMIYRIKEQNFLNDQEQETNKLLEFINSIKEYV